MDDSRFDLLTQTLAASRSRRGILRALIGSTLGSVVGLTGRSGGVEAKPACRNEGHPCEGGQTCCDGLVCVAAGRGRARRCGRCPAGQIACGDGCIDACTARDDCHLAGVCDPSTGQCTNPAAPEGTPCADGNACVAGATCLGGVCQGGTPLVCTTDNPCLTAACDPVRGCVTTPKEASTPCDADGNACSATNACDGTGQCLPGTPVACDACFRCNPDEGICEPDPNQDGSPCPGDGNLCFGAFQCAAGVCNGVNEQQCAPLDDCHVAGVCDRGTGQCSNPNAPDGTVCSAGPNETGTCSAGQCQAVCNDGYAECASQSGPGCLTDVLTDPLNCGACAESGGQVCAAGERCTGGVCGAAGAMDAICVAALDGCTSGASRCDDGTRGICYCTTSTEDTSRCTSLSGLTCEDTCTTSADCPGAPRSDGSGTFGPDAFCARVDGCCGAGVAVCLEPCPSYCTVDCACPQACIGSSCIGPGPQVAGELTVDSPTFDRCHGSGSGYAYGTDSYAHAGGALAINARGAPSGGGTLDDTYLYLYTTFDPTAPCANLVAENDDNGCSLESRIVGTFPAGTYTVVVTTFRTGLLGSYTLEYNRCSPCEG